MRSSRLPYLRTLTDFDFAFQPSIKREQIDALHELGFLERKENVVFLGSPGVGKPGRYHSIAHDPEALQALLTELFVESWPGRLPPSRLVLDIDSTDDAVHGRQEGRCFHGYYGHYCFLRLYIFCGKHPLCAMLRPGNSAAASSARLRRQWPGLGILVRADSACLCPRGAAGLMRGQRRGLRHRRGQELAAHGQDRPGACRRPRTLPSLQHPQPRRFGREGVDFQRPWVTGEEPPVRGFGP